MYVPRLRNITLILLAGLGVSACGYDRGYGYGGLSVGYGGYGGGYYSPYRGNYYGWYDDFYYPGVGCDIYDRGGHRHRWSDRHRRYWEGRRGSARSYQPNWGGYRYQRRDYRDDNVRGGRDGYRSRDTYRSRDGRRSRDDGYRGDRRGDRNR